MDPTITQRHRRQLGTDHTPYTRTKGENHRYKKRHTEEAIQPYEPHAPITLTDGS